MNNLDEFLDDMSGDNEDGDNVNHPIMVVDRDDIDMDHKDSVSENAAEDYEFIRRNLRQVIETNINAMQRLTKIAGESESPRCFEVLGDYMEQVVKSNEALMKLHKDTKDIVVSDSDSSSPESGDNQGGTGGVMFVGSVEDLLDSIEKRDKMKDIDGGQVIEED